MEPTTFILILAAIIPAVFYILYIVMIDSHKPEPRSMLIAAALVGAAVAFALIKLGAALLPEGLQITTGLPLMESIAIGVLKLAIPVEVAKWVALFIFLALNKYYDEYLDGMVYSVCLAMGFAGVWNVWFMTNAIDATSLEMVEICVFIIFILVPIHLAASSMMGYFFALARNRHKIRNYVLAFLLPMLISGSLFSLLFLLGGHGAYYFIIGIVYSILSMIFHSQLFRLIKKDTKSVGNN